MSKRSHRNMHKVNVHEYQIMRMLGQLDILTMIVSINAEFEADGRIWVAIEI